MDVSSSAADDGENDLAIGEDHKNPFALVKRFQILVGCDFHRADAEIYDGCGVDKAIADSCHGAMPDLFPSFGR